MNERWVCYVCNQHFDEPKIVLYTEDVNGEGAYQNFYCPVCPLCGSECIEEEWEDEYDALD